MADATDTWPEGFLPANFVESCDAEPARIMVGDVDFVADANFESPRDINTFVEKACRAINVHDKLVVACEAALSALKAHTGDAAISSSTEYEQALLAAALAAARKPES